MRVTAAPRTRRLPARAARSRRTWVVREHRPVADQVYGADAVVHDPERLFGRHRVAGEAALRVKESPPEALVDQARVPRTPPSGARAAARPLEKRGCLGQPDGSPR